MTGACRAYQTEDKLIFGLDEKSVIFDGQTRRGVMVFELPQNEKIEDWEIGSLVLENVSAPVDGTPYTGGALFSERLIIKDDIESGFWTKLEKKVAELMAQRSAKAYERPGTVSAKPVDLDTADLGKQPIPVIGASSPGARKMKTVSGIKDIWKLIADLDWVLSDQNAWSQRYAPGAVLTQGWGDPSDLAGLAEHLLNQQGVRTARSEVKLTGPGKLELAKTMGTDNVRIESLPALRYAEPSGKKHFIVFPWCQEMDGVKDWVTWDGSKNEPGDRREKVQMQVKLEIEPIASQQNTGNTHVAASALAGGGSVAKSKWVTVLDETIFSNEISLDAVDMGYTEIRKDGHPSLQILLEGPMGRKPGREGVNLDQYQIKNEWIGVNMDGGWKVAQQPVDPEHPITGRFHVLSVNAPDLDPKTVDELEALRKRKYTQAEVPDGLSALRWYGRTVIDRFIAAQTRFEKQLAKKLDLGIGRSLNGRCILVTVQRANTEADPATRMDLLQVANDIHGSQRSDPVKTHHAFNILSGMAAARFEAAAIPGGGMGLFELWAHCPEDTKLAYIDHSNKRAFTDMLKEKGFPETFVKSLYDCRSAILFPTNPAIINDKARWGWLEIDPKTYCVVSRLDNGAAGAMVEGIIGNLFQQANSYLVGALVGIDVSLWSVSGYSLQLEDYDEICKKSYAFASGFSKKFSVNEEMTGPVGWDIGGSPDVELAKFDRFIKFSLDFGGIKASNNMLGFKNGYKDAVEFYFSD